jgi:hypothetical protein
MKDSSPQQSPIHSQTRDQYCCKLNLQRKCQSHRNVSWHRNLVAQTGNKVTFDEVAGIALAAQRSARMHAAEPHDAIVTLPFTEHIISRTATVAVVIVSVETQPVDEHNPPNEKP